MQKVATVSTGLLSYNKIITYTDIYLKKHETKKGAVKKLEHLDASRLF